MIFGYARVSTAKQANEGTSLDGQEERLRAAGIDAFLSDVGTGANTDREGFKQLLQGLRDGDTVVVTKLDRFGRSMSDLVTILDDWRSRGIVLKSLDDGIDTGTPMGIAMAQMVGIFAEMERQRINERTTEGRERAKANGVKFGRPAFEDVKLIKRTKKFHADPELSVKEACGALGIGRTKYYELLKM